MKPVKLRKEDWLKIREDLLLIHPKSATIMRWKMKEVLGFTLREATSVESKFLYLDFFDEKKQSFFLLKYSEYINDVYQRY